MNKEIKIIKPYDYSIVDARYFDKYRDEKFGVGKEFINNKGFKFKIIAKSKKRCCRYVEFESGYITEASTTLINRGKVRDKLSPYAYGVGICDMENAKFHPLYDRWNSMLSRCYSKKNKSYKHYGGRGVKVCDEWLVFSNFVRDIEAKENYNEMINSKKKWHIDKDIKGNGSNIYSNDTVSIVLGSDNNIEMNKRNVDINKDRRIKIVKYDLDMKKICEYESMAEASNDTGISVGNICSCCNGKLNTAGGYIWKKKGCFLI